MLGQHFVQTSSKAMNVLQSDRASVNHVGHQVNAPVLGTATLYPYVQAQASNQICPCLVELGAGAHPDGSFIMS